LCRFRQQDLLHWARGAFAGIIAVFPDPTAMPRLPFRLLFAALPLALSLSVAAADTALTTVSERSGFLKTGRYDEVGALCDAFVKAYPKAVRCLSFGTSPEGRPMKALVASTIRMTR